MPLAPLFAIPLNLHYGGLALIATSNYFLMRRMLGVKAGEVAEPKFTVLIPARNEADNLRQLIPQLLSPASRGWVNRVVVFDDESSDGTGEIAQSLGATVIRPPEALPAGWTGKNRACHELGNFATADGTRSEWIIFLDADVRVSEDFFSSLGRACELVPAHTGCITGFPNLVPGRFPEPIVLAWVGWILLATNPFGVVSTTQRGHNQFTNGQITVWRSEIWNQLQPNEFAKNRILEDVVIGRYLASKKIHVEVMNMSDFMQVRMYHTWREALDGMSKNSFEIMNSYAGAMGLAALLFLISSAWVLIPWGYCLLVLSGFFSFSVCRPRRSNPLPIAAASLLMPLLVLVGGLTILRSCYWKAAKKTQWKGRIYR